MSRSPRVVFGLPAYNHAEHVAEAVESLLGQRSADLAVVAVDDCSSDDTFAILEKYQRLDPRIVHLGSNPCRLGMIGNFRRTFELAREHCPDAEFFAWGSDHDMWHPYWLEAMIHALESDAAAVLAYPVYLKVAESGRPRGPGGWEFETRGVGNRRARFRQVMAHMSAGNMIYGLYRRPALERAGIKRRVLLPDRMLMAELALYGTFVQVPELLWYRRHYRGRFSVGQQRRSLFGDRRPLWAWLPWWLGHAGALGRALTLEGSGRPEIGRLQGLALALECALFGVWSQLDRTYRRFKKGRLFRRDR